MPLCAFSQSMLVTLKSGEQVRYSVQDIEKLTFDETKEDEPPVVEPPVEDGYVSLSVFTDPYMLEQVSHCDTDGDGKLSPEEIAAVKTLDLHEVVSYDDDGNLIPMPRKENIAGLEYFTELTSLNLSSCILLTEIDLTALEKLEHLQTGFCDNLETIKLGNKPALSELYVMYSRKLANIDLDGVTALQQASLTSTALTSISLPNLKTLTKLTVGSKELASLDVSGCDNLEELYILDAKQFDGFDIAPFQKLQTFSLTYSKITSFNTATNPGLRSLTLDNSDKLIRVDVSKSLKLKMLSCFSCWELQEVIITEGMNYEDWYGIYSYQITKLPREYPEDIATELLDPGFRALMVELADTDGDGKISAEEAQAITSLNGANKGLDEADLFYFPNLTEIDLSNNNLKEIDLSQQKGLQSLKINNNQLTALDVTNTSSMKYLDASYNEIASSVRLNGYGYEEVNLSHNKIPQQTVYFQSKLVKLDLSYNEISDADIRENSILEYMDVSHNNISEITMWSLKKLVNVKFNDNPFIQLNDSKNWTLLETIDCSNTNISELNLSQTTVLKEAKATGCPNLETVYIGSNAGATIDVDSNVTILEGAPE